MNYTSRRWRVLIASCIVNLCIGSSYAWSVFSSPMAEYLSGVTGVAMTSATLAIVFTISNSYGPIPMIVGSIINDKRGPRFLITLGGILFGLGMIICSFAQSRSLLIVGYGLFVGVGIGLAYGCTINNSIKFFPDKRGLIGGLVTASYGFSSVIVPIIANKLISGVGILNTFRVFGIAFIIIICACSFFIEKCPADFVPDGYQPPVTSSGASAVVNKNWKDMIKDPVYYIMLALFTSGCFFGMMVISQASSIAQNMAGFSVAAAATSVSILALFNMGGRIVCGFLSDKIGRINTLTIMLVVAIIGLLSLALLGTAQATFLVGVCLVGLSFGAFLGIFPGFVADQFGPKNNTVNYALVFLGMAIAGIAGPMSMSSLYRSIGSYVPALFIAIVLAVIGVVLTFIFRIVSKKQSN